MTWELWVLIFVFWAATIVAVLSMTIALLVVAAKVEFIGLCIRDRSHNYGPLYLRVRNEE